MELIFMKSATTDFLFEKERQLLKTGLLISHKLNAITPTLTGIVVYKARHNATAKDLLNNYIFYFSNLGNGYTEKEIDDYYAVLITLRNKKSKSRQELIHLGKLEHSLKRITEDVERAAKNWMSNNHIESLMEFEADNSLVIFDEMVETTEEELFYQNILMDEILNPVCFFIMGTNKIYKDGREEW